MGLLVLAGGRRRPAPGQRQREDPRVPRHHPHGLRAQGQDRGLRAPEGVEPPPVLPPGIVLRAAPALRSPTGYAQAFSNAPFPLTPAYDEQDVSDKPAFVRSRPRVSSRTDEQYERDYRDRLRALRTVDDSIAEIVGILRDEGELDNTYIVLWTDNGYHTGEHRLPAGKQTHYGTDTNFPMIVRGPGVGRDVEDDRLVLNTDLAPTFLAWANASQVGWTDGRPLESLLDAATDPPAWRSHVLLEGRTPEGNAFGMPDYTGVLSQTGEKFVRYANGEQEYYDLDTDPYELESRPEDAPQVLKERLQALEGCAASSCKTAENGVSPGR